MRTTARPGRSLEHGASANRNPRKQQGICYATDAIGASSPDHHPGAAPFFPAEDLSLLRKYRQRGGPPHQRRCRPRAVDRTPVRTGPPELCRDRGRQEGSERGDEKASFSTARSRMLKVAPATPTEIWTSAHSIPKSTRSTTCWRLSAAVELRLQSRVLLLARNPGHTEMKELRTSTLASLQGKTLWGRAPIRPHFGCRGGAVSQLSCLKAESACHRKPTFSNSYSRPVDVPLCLRCIKDAVKEPRT
jgi:hypothetical protein